MRNILAVGAYERDNFGDYLFYEVLKRALPKDNVIPGSVIAGDMRQSYGIVTIPYRFVLDRYDIDAVWVVGGEVGGVDVMSALNMSVGYSHDNPFSSSILENISKILGTPEEGRAAYIPEMTAYLKNKKKPLVVNSVGLRNLSQDSLSTMTGLKNAKRVIVRDTVSLELCKKNGIKAVLAPDVVHSIPKFYKPSKAPKSILVQINKRIIETYGIEVIQDAVRQIYTSLRIPVLFFAAGTANGHDSIDLYSEIVEGLKDIDANVVVTRDPLKIIDYIAAAELVIATSLHARIISTAYNIPRISIENKKTQQYAQEWDPEWPSGILVSELASVATKLERTVKHDNRLETMAYESLMKSISTLGEVSKKTERLSPIDLSFDWYAFQQQESINVATTLVTDYEQYKISKNKEIKRIESAMNKVLGSRTYRIGKFVIAPLRYVRSKYNRLKG